jgi:hypothetical protein
MDQNPVVYCSSVGAIRLRVETNAADPFFMPPASSLRLFCPVPADAGSPSLDQILLR